MADLLELLGRAGTACTLQLAGAPLAVERAAGACLPLLGLSPEALAGRSLSTLLEECAPMAEQASGVAEAACPASGRALVAALARDGERTALLLVDAGLRGEGRGGAFADLAGAVAHDLRNPLATVKLNLQVIARQADALDERAARRLAIALREVATLERGLQALSECARPAAASRAPAELAPLLQALAPSLEAELGFAPRVELEDGLGPVAAEGERLSLALGALARLVGHGGGELALQARRAEPGRIRLVVRREGFELPARRSLAIALAQRVADDAGGRFFPERDSQGTSLVLELPAAR